MNESSRPSEKEGLRRVMRERLATLDPEADRAAAERLADRVSTHPEVAHARRLFVCLSFGVEIDTWGLADRLVAAG
ncbi:MAG: 5-formyltetrahydrofolate cyclo-ligase, partial [Acidobacteriota bacterium]